MQPEHAECSDRFKASEEQCRKLSNWKKDWKVHLMNIRTSQQYPFTAGSLLIAVILLGLLGGGWAGPAYAEVEGDRYQTGELVVKLDPTSDATIDEINATYGTTTLKTLLGSAEIYLVRLPSGTDPEATAKSMSGDPRLLYAEPNFIGAPPEGGGSYRAWAEPTTTSSSDQYAVDALNLSCAQSVTLGEGTMIAVLDTGAQLDHPALEASLTTGKERYDFVDDDPNPADDPNGLDDDADGVIDEMVGHGTHVAGIVDLVAPEARIMPLRILDSEGHGDVFAAAEAISFASRKGADVLNLSFGTQDRSKLLDDVIGRAAKEGVVTVAAAGNLNTDVPQYPAAAEDAGTLAVTSVGPDDVKSDFANFGGWVDVAAPGEGIHSAFPTSAYASATGTSMATPFVAGQAALIKSVAPSLGIESVEGQITKTARSLDASNPAYAGKLGAGLPDIGASVGCGSGGTTEDGSEAE